MKLLLALLCTCLAVAQDASADLQRAIGSGNHAAVMAALEAGGDIDARGNGGQTPLMASVLKGNLEIVKSLLDKGADFTIPENDGWVRGGCEAAACQ
jgi:ankyrin repeat protein